MTTPDDFSARLKTTLVLSLRVLIALLSILIAVVAVCEWLGWPFMRTPIENFLQAKLQRTVRVAEPFSLHMLGKVRLQAGSLWIAAPQGFDVPYLLDAHDVKLSLGYDDIWAMKNNGALHIAALTVKSIDTQLVRHANGTTTWQFNHDDTKSPNLPVIDDLQVWHGKLLLRDPLMQADITASFDTQEGSAKGISASHVSAKGLLRKYPIEGQIDTAGFLPIANAQANTLLKSLGWVTYGGVRVDFDGLLSDLLGKLNLHGKVKVKGPSLAVLGMLTKTALPTTGAFTLSGVLDKSGTIWNADIAKATIGKSQLSGKFKVDTLAKIPTLEGQLKGQRFVLADLAPAFGVLTPDGDVVKPPSGRMIPDRPLDLPSLKTMDAHVDIDLDYVDLGNAFSQPIAPLKAMLTLEQGKLTLANITANTAKGSIKGQLSVATTSSVPLWQANLVWDGIQLEEWIKIADQRAKVAKRGKKKTDANAPPYFTGTLYGKAVLQGSGRSTAELFSSLDGEISAYIRKGSISHLVIEGLGLDLAQGLGLLIRHDNSLAMDCAVVNVTATSGLIIPRVALIDTPVTLVLSDGNINLNTEHLALRVTAKPKNFSPFTLRTPIHVDGTFLKPVISVEKWPIALRVISAIALGSINPLAAILPMFDLGAKTPDKGSCKQTIETIQQEAAARKNKIS